VNLDFNKSSIGWKTKSNSVGLFKIESVISEKDHNPFYLSSAVMAGDVYGQGLLPREPHYHFLWATDGQDVIIYRIYGNQKITIEERTSADYRNILIRNQITKYEPIEIEDLFSTNDLINFNMICQLDISDQFISFPVKHINVLKEKKIFQIETGPVLLRHNREVIPCFLFINSLDFCQVVPYYPLLGKKTLILSSRAKFFIYA